MKHITANSPCKLIITGEHAVVYGNPALAVAIEPHCTATLREVKENGSPGFVVRTFEITATGKKIKSELRAIGALNALLEHFKTKYNLQPRTGLELTLTIPRIKGIGSSASIAAAISKVLFSYINKKPTSAQLFNAIQTLENVAHGGKASGIDAAAVLYGAVRAEKKKGKGGKMKFTRLKRISLPAGCALVVVDTKRAKPRKGTGEMVKLAALRLAGNKEMLQHFSLIYREISKQLNKNGNPQRLGALFNSNHTLLATLGVSSEGIELARSISLENGAYGAKITGAGGEGGAIVALVPVNKLAKVISALMKNNFRAFRTKFA